MGLFDFLGKKSSEEAVSKPTVPWNKLSRLEQLDEIEALSETIPVAIFKHSTRCGISGMVLRQFESNFDLPESLMKLYFLDLLAHRDISNEVSARFQVIHQSPQLIIVKNRNVVAHASHYSINQLPLEELA